MIEDTKIEEVKTEAQEIATDKEPDAPSPQAVPVADHLHGGNWKTSRKLRRKEHHDLLHRMNTKMLAVRIAIVTTVLFLLTVALAVVLYVQMLDAEERYNEELGALGQENGLLEADKSKALTELADLKEARDVLQNQLVSTQEELVRVKNELDELIEKDAVISTLNQTITDLQAQITEKDAQIALLEDQLERDVEIDLRPLLNKLQTVQNLLEVGAPLQTVSVKKADEYGNPYFEEEQVYPNISVTMTDTKTGYTYLWETGKVYETGEFKHLLYALALLECATEEQNGLGNHGAGNRTYNLTEQYVLSKDHIIGGSGILKNETPGTTYTYLELIEIMLSYCDVTAYSRLLARYGNEPLQLLLSDIEGISTTENADRLNVSDMMLVLKRVMKLIESSSPYAGRLKLALTSAIATYYSQSVTGTVGRQVAMTSTGYHEVGILFDEQGEILVTVMSDVTNINAEWSSYLLALYRAMDDMIQSFR